VNPDVAVIVVTYNSEAVVGQLLDSLSGALDGLRADVVVVDNSSTDATVALLSERTDCRVVVQPNRGFSAGINAGVRVAAPAPAIVILNPDARLGQGSIRLLVAALGLDRVGIAVPRVTNERGELELSLRREPTLLRALGLNDRGWPRFAEYVQEPAAYQSSHSVDWALGAVMATSRRCFDELGGWDESFFLYSEETDYCLRARDRGLLTWFAADATAVHIGGGSGRNDRTHQMQILNRVRLYRRRHGAAASWAYYWLTVLSELSWLLRGSPHARASIRSLLRPSTRPEALGLGTTLVPA
jgi:GT2 family glycosyltransferase